MFTDAKARFGIEGIPTWYVRNPSEPRLRRMLRRYRRQLEHLSDRHLARRYARYLRWTELALSMYADGSSWPARGLIAQACRRLYVAHSLLRERGLHVPEGAEAWADVRASEVYHENAALLEELPSLPRDDIARRLAETEGQLLSDPDSHALNQRQMILWGEMHARDRAQDAESAGAVMEVSPKQARLLRERVVQQMTRKLGYRWTHTEAQQTLDALGIRVRPPKSESESMDSLFDAADQEAAYA